MQTNILYEFMPIMMSAGKSTKSQAISTIKPGLVWDHCIQLWKRAYHGHFFCGVGRIYSSHSHIKSGLAAKKALNITNHHIWGYRYAIYSVDATASVISANKIRKNCLLLCPKSPPKCGNASNKKWLNGATAIAAAGYRCKPMAITAPISPWFVAVMKTIVTSCTLSPEG